MYSNCEFKLTHQDKLTLTSLGKGHNPYISMIIEKGEFDDIVWSYPLDEIVQNYDVMCQSFPDWFYQSDCGNTVFYLDEEHRERMSNSDHLTTHYLWNRLFVEDEVIKDALIAAKENLNTFKIYSLDEIDTMRTKTTILNVDPDTGSKFALLQVFPEKYMSYAYIIHGLFDAPFGEDITIPFFRWVNHMRRKLWFTTEHLNDLINIAYSHWKLKMFDVR